MQTDVEKYGFSQRSDDTDLITWIEASGLALGNVLDHRRNSMATRANQGRDVIESRGRLVSEPKVVKV